MNQILSTKLIKNRKKYNKKKWFKIQFIFSISITIILMFILFYYFNFLRQNENFSNDLISNYNIYKLYNNDIKNSDNKISNDLFGIIEIPKIKLYYPVFSHLNDKLLKISPCKFYGNSPNINGNLCIAGHNYDNSLFFSKISSLSRNDEIIIYDINNNKYVYWVYNIYEVKETDLSPILDYKKDEKFLTLITCNNFNLNRIIVRAKQKK